MATSTVLSMATRNIETAFGVEDMTSLRYAIPFIKSCRDLLEINVPLIYDGSRQSGKYNCIASWRERFEEIALENGVETIDASRGVVQIDTLFCVENCLVRGTQGRRLFSFQHGFDYVNLHGNTNSTYLVTDPIAGSYLAHRGKKVIRQPFPVTFWDWEHQFEKIQLPSSACATLFYPEIDHHQTFSAVHARLTDLGFDLFIKQREKNQKVPHRFRNVHYDRWWYPSESIVLPIISDACVGFGTSAYTDIVHLGKPFIDLCLPGYSKTYPKPSAKNFVCITENFLDSFCKLDLPLTTVQEKIRMPFDREEVKAFLLEVLG